LTEGRAIQQVWSAAGDSAAYGHPALGASNNPAIALNWLRLYAEPEALARRALRESDSSSVPARTLVALRCSLAWVLNALERHEEASTAA
jgi:hypothetical protein